MPPKKSLLIFGIALLVIILGVLGSRLLPHAPRPATTPQEALSAFPNDMPLEVPLDKTRVLSTSTPSGIAYTLQFTSRKTALENYQTYESYLKQNGWTITPGVATMAYSRLLAKKGTDLFTLNGFMDPRYIIEAVSHGKVSTSTPLKVNGVSALTLTYIKGK